MSTTTIKEVTGYLETLAPKAYQENYDNVGLLTGDPSWIVNGALVTLDCTEKVVEEAIQTNCNLIVAHHPILFKGLKKLTGQTYVERTIIKAIQNNIALYAIHTNLDNVFGGVNKKIGERIGLKNMQVLAPKYNTLLKLTTYVPKEYKGQVLQALHNAGAGNIGEYKNCSFQLEGIGTFMPTSMATPHIGKPGVLEEVEECVDIGWRERSKIAGK